jgi:hypothetical protein
VNVKPAHYATAQRYFMVYVHSDPRLPHCASQPVNRIDLIHICPDWRRLLAG